MDAEAMLEAQPIEVRERLEKDGLVVLVIADNPEEESNADSNAVVGFVFFDASSEETYRMLSQSTRQIEYRSELTAIENVEWNEAGPVDRHSIKILFVQLDYHLQFHLDPTSRTITWELHPGYKNGLSHVDGRWELHPMRDGRTLGVFSTVVDVGSGVPRFMQDYVTAKNLPTTLSNCRRWVNSQGKFRP